MCTSLLLCVGPLAAQESALEAQPGVAERIRERGQAVIEGPAENEALPVPGLVQINSDDGRVAGKPMPAVPAELAQVAKEELDR